MKTDFKRLRAAIDWSVSQLEVSRNKRVEYLRQLVGRHYARGGADKRVPVNQLELAMTIYTRKLAARAPQVMVSTGVDELKPHAFSMQLALNQIPREIGLASTLQKAVQEAMVGIGVVKIGLCSSGNAILGHDAGEPFVDLVTPDDYFVDMSAKSRSGIQFEGNDYWLPLDAARAMGNKNLEPDQHTVHGDAGEQRAESIGSDEGADVYADKVWLRDVWLPHENRVLTYSVKGHELIREVEWDGQEHGPYYTLSFSDVPGNILPLPPAALWIDLHELSNTLFRKLARQGESKKTVAAFAGGNEESVEALKKAKDGEGIRYQGQKPESLTVGGVDAETLAFFLQTKDLFNYHAGNLDALGGLGPQSDTASQDELLTQGATARLARMKADTVEFAREIFEALAWYEWTDPVRERIVDKPVRGTDMVHRVRWSEETREGNYLDYNFSIDPYSMEDDTPEIRLQKIGQILERFIYPVLPVLQQQGGQIDFRKLVETISRLSHVDELRDMVVFGEPIQGMPQQGGAGQPEAGSFKPAETRRVYERVNRPGATRHGKDDAMSRILMGAGVQQSEASAIGRPVS